MSKEGNNFNALELLARLRGEKLISLQESNGNTNSFSSPSRGNGLTSKSNNEFDHNNMSPLTKSNLQSNQPNNSSAQKLNNLNNSNVTSISFLTPSERRENIEVRGELDKEIKRLQNEVLNLKKDKKQLLQENQLLKDEIKSNKTKYDLNIAKLRDKIAKMSSHIESIDLINERRSQVYSSMGIFGMAAQANVTNKKKTSPKSTPTNKNNTPQQSSNSKSINNENNNTVKLPNGYVQSLPYSFAEPTFSELMRRSTAESKDFVNSLRYTPGVGQPPTIIGPLDTPKSQYKDFNDDSSDLLDSFDYNNTNEHSVDEEDDDSFPVVDIDLR